MVKAKQLKCEIYRDSMQNYKRYAIPPAQLIIADVPYNVGNNFYGSNPMWYNGGDNKNGESKLAGKAAFNSDFNFNLYEFFHFCSKMLKKDDVRPSNRGRSSDSPCMIVFCSFEQISTLIAAAKKYGFVHYIPLVFVKNYSPQVLKANMRVVGATEYALCFYRNKLPKFRNGLQVDENGKNIRGTGHMVFNWFTWEKDAKDIPKIHPAQKPVNVIKKLIEIFTDPGDVVIDPCCGSGSTLRAAHETGRSAYGFEIDRTFFNRAKNEMLMFNDEQKQWKMIFAGWDWMTSVPTQKGERKMIDAKEYLKQVRLYDTHIDGKLQDLEDLKAMATKITTTLKLDATFGSGNQDRLGEVVVKIIDLQNEINQAVDDFVDLKRDVNAILDKITDPEQLQVLYKRYFEYKTWEQIACELNMTWRNALYVHGAALQSVAVILERKGEEPEQEDRTAAWIEMWEADEGEEFIEGYRCSECGFTVDWEPGLDADGLALLGTCPKCKREMVEKI